MRQRYFLCFLWTALILRGDILVAAEADPAILNGADLPHLQQGHIVNDPRPRLSASQQAQILSDVQQHQQRYRQRPTQDFKNPRVNFPTFEQAQSSTPFSSLAKYKVDRAKQQLQQLQQQQQQVQQLLQQQQQKVAQQLGTSNFVNGGEGGIQSPQFQRQQYLQQQQYNNHYNQNGFQNLRQDLSQPLFSNQHTIQLQEYLEKQRELELLQKQRQQLLYEQQELRRQQELLRLQQLQRLTSTTPSPPTTISTPIAVSTTSVPLLLSSPTARRITPSEAELFLKAIANHQKKYTTTAASTIATATTTTTTPPPARRLITNTHRETDIPENLLSLVQDQESQLLQQGKSKPQIKVIYQTEKPSTARQNSGGRSRSSQLSERELLLKQLKLALAQSGDDDVVRNVTTRDLILPNGKKIQVIHAPNGLSSISPSGSPTILTSAVPSSTTIKPPKALFEELTKGGVLPPGADFEVIRQKSDGKLEEVGKTPIIQNLPAKKVTFVLLEEQPDGSYKVQGVKGNANDKESGSDVESIVEKIKKGELKLPPSSLGPTTQSSTLEHLESNLDPNLIVSTGTSRTPVSSVHSVSTTAATFRPTTVRSTSTRYSESKSSTTEYIPYVTVSPNSVSTTDKYVTSASSVTGHVYNALNPSPTKTTLSDHIPRVTTKYSSSTRSQFIPTMAPVNEIVTTTATTPTSYHTSNSYAYFSKHSSPETSAEAVKSQTLQENLATLLKREGLYAMAKYLRQSGLDTVLNETGPYTIFIPTDKAFRTLLVQLGGPEKAEQKFHDNPRLLSGLLLHHVIPGAFRIDSLQDEMTGVSLAGTQLRVNEYAMQDHEWNDVKVTTINGARVAPNKRDIEIPQGIAHAVDRVMFPLPVGDLVQTLQADRERRFTTFLRMLHVSGLEDTLTGPKTFTIFAPTDSAFTDTSTKNGVPIWTEEDGPEAAKTIISRHVIPTTLYTAGMRYYIQKDTLRPQSPIHIHKNGGRVRVNEAHVVTHNVPATNGVLHAIDGVL
ncbi:PREDICTED: histone-lysine N-methyltransferase 2D isoform X1 [Cyphomyrmex costatus]|uniref:histone-lysine N-methyltransferase 2D isoform X1 n=1 Tax=Cyphomyrmex costatus TaxID=456900 RepID=UPI0008523D7C|nr:PREDICTED: histone-lysine N-methyltransferase 2D isoform X1 [Cyphomyrmex costatus]